MLSFVLYTCYFAARGGEHLTLRTIKISFSFRTLFLDQNKARKYYHNANQVLVVCLNKIHAGNKNFYKISIIEEKDGKVFQTL